MMRDHPVIEAMERTGYPDDDFQIPHCPVCGSECETVYLDATGEVIGCDECLSEKNAYDCPECFRKDER